MNNKFNMKKYDVKHVAKDGTIVSCKAVYAPCLAMAYELAATGLYFQNTTLQVCELVKKGFINV